MKLEGDDSDSSGNSFISLIIKNSKKKAVQQAKTGMGISIISKPEDLEKFIKEKGNRKEKAKESGDDCDS